MTYQTTLYPEHRELIEVSSSWIEGQSLTHDELLEIMVMPRKCNKYYREIHNLNEELLKRGQYLKTIHGLGYKFLTANDMLDLSVEEFEKTNRRLKKSATILAGIKKDKLSEENRPRYDYIMNKIHQVYAVCSGSLVEAKLLLKPDKQFRLTLN